MTENDLTAPIRVLVVEDNPADARLVYELLLETGVRRFETQFADRLGLALHRLQRESFDALLLDLSLPDAQGIESIAAVQAVASDLPILILTGLNDEDVALEAVSNGAQDYLVKGQSNTALLTRALRYAIERKRTEQRLTYLAQFDPLTNLPNRALFRDRLEQALKRAKRSAHSVGLMFLDLDHFKDINDTLGHEAGDKLLTAAARRIRDCVRDQDTVARLGGDEFTVILPDITELNDAKRVAKAIGRAMAKPLLIDNHELYVSTSIGISMFPQDGDGPDCLIKSADIALYAAKQKGRSVYEVFESSMTNEMAERVKIATKLRQALERDEFTLHYQPQFDLQNNELTGMEALLRWTNPALGSVPPATFIPLLEETGLITAVGDWVLRSACLQLRAWDEAGLPPTRVAVNLSPRQFRQRNLVTKVEEILSETGTSSDRIQLEITESALLSDSRQNLTTLHGLRELGIKISIDDFGTGFSSLGYLRLFPFDALKLDKSFINAITIDPNGAAIVSAVIALAHSLQLRVIAEGVELTNEFAFLAQQGCDEVQGFLLSRPLDALACGAWMQQRLVAATLQ